MASKLARRFISIFSLLFGILFFLLFVYGAGSQILILAGFIMIIIGILSMIPFPDIIKYFINLIILITYGYILVVLTRFVFSNLYETILFFIVLMPFSASILYFILIIREKKSSYKYREKMNYNHPDTEE
jgi:phosphoglycerol transferase MdoB-like AlkP superfamily enzyme